MVYEMRRLMANWLNGDFKYSEAKKTVFFSKALYFLLYQCKEEIDPSDSYSFSAPLNVHILTLTLLFAWSLCALSSCRFF